MKVKFHGILPWFNSILIYSANQNFGLFGLFQNFRLGDGESWKSLYLNYLWYTYAIICHLSVPLAWLDAARQVVQMPLKGDLHFSDYRFNLVHFEAKKCLFVEKSPG
jgi:hypothetical protein